jgi:hypothetical protein
MGGHVHTQGVKQHFGASWSLKLKGMTALVLTLLLVASVSTGGSGILCLSA